MSQKISRFLRYSLIGGTTFLLDLCLLFVFTDIFHIYYVASAGLGFVVAVSLNYLFSRRYVFKGTLRSVHAGYGIFLLIAGVGLVAITGLMALFVGVFGWNYLFSRIIIAGIVGFWNYLMNLYVNFKVVGKVTKEPHHT
jgi:putative flippase GtrA